jgi:hypothetical protein
MLFLFHDTPHPATSHILWRSELMRWTVRRIYIFTVTFPLLLLREHFCYEQFTDDSCVLGIPFWDFTHVYFSLPTSLPLRFLLLFSGQTSIYIWTIPQFSLIRFSWKFIHFTSPAVIEKESVFFLWHLQCQICILVFECFFVLKIRNRFFLNITNRMQRYTILFIVVNGLHVSGGFSAHHQELKNSTHSIGYIPLAVVASKPGIYPMLCVEFLSSWLWTEKPPETCRSLTTIKNIV